VATVGTIVSSQHAPPTAIQIWARRWFSEPSWFTPDLWIAVGRTVRDRAVSAGYPEQRLRVIWSGYAVPQSKPRTSSWGSRPTVLITVGRLVESKGVDVLLRVLAGLPEHFTLQVVGDGPQRARLQEMADGLGVTRRVAFLGYRDDVSDLLHAAHIFVTATRHEGLAGYALLEAASAGMPIVCSDIPEIREVFDKDEVIAVPQAGERQFAEAIRGIDGKTAERLGTLARARVISAFHPESIGAGLLSAYGEASRLRTSLPPDGASPSPTAGGRPGA
jgi:glycosyltransferase involved in cell wall biosynthesis